MLRPPDSGCTVSAVAVVRVRGAALGSVSCVIEARQSRKELRQSAQVWRQGMVGEPGEEVKSFFRVCAAPALRRGVIFGTRCREGVL